MARLEWVILTERTIIEAHSNTVSLQSILETIVLPPPPADHAPQPGQNIVVPYRFYVNQQWVRSDINRGERVSGRVLLSGPDSKQYAESNFEVDLEIAPRARAIGQLTGFPLLGEGVYPVAIQARAGKHWRTVGRTQFSVAFNPHLVVTGVIAH